jgi:hypothetical protein
VHWCEKSRLLTRANQRLNAIGGLWYPACQKCINEFDPDQVEVAPMSEDDTAWELNMADEYAIDHHWSKPVSPVLWWAAGISFVLGLVFVISGAGDNTSGLGLSNGTPGAPLIIAGVLLILAAITVGIVWFVKATSSQVQHYGAWKATLPQGQQAGISLAETAVLAAGTYVAHEELKHHRERVAAEQAATRQRSAALRQNLQATNDANWQQQDNAAAGLVHKTNNQIGYGALIGQQHPVVPGPTRRSDEFGNYI